MAEATPFFGERALQKAHIISYLKFERVFMAEKRQKSKKEYCLRFSAIEFIGASVYLAAMGYLSVYLQSTGMESSQIGIIYSLNSLVSICATLFWGVISDKIRSVRKVYMICLLSAAIIWPFIPATIPLKIKGYSLAILTIPLSAFVRMPIGGLTDNWVLQFSNKFGANYGRIRLWGTIGYVVLGLVLTAILPFTGVRATFYIYSGLVLFVFIMTLFVGEETLDKGQKQNNSFKDLQLSRLFKNYYLMAYMLFTVVMYCGSEAFLPYLMEEIGMDTNRLGMLYSIRSLLELPILYMAAKLRKRIALPVFILIQGTLYVVMYLSYSCVQGAVLFVIVTMLQGLTTGIDAGLGSAYIFALAPEELKSTAHLMSYAMAYLANMLGSLFGGFFVDLMGVRSYYLVTGLMISGALLLYALTFVLGKKVFKIPLPNHVRSMHKQLQLEQEQKAAEDQA